MPAKLDSLIVATKATQAENAYADTSWIDDAASLTLEETKADSVIVGVKATQAELAYADTSWISAAASLTLEETKADSIVVGVSHRDYPANYTTSEVVQNSNRFIPVETILKVPYNIPAITSLVGTALLDGCTYSQLQALAPNAVMSIEPTNNAYLLTINDIEIEITF